MVDLFSPWKSCNCSSIQSWVPYFQCEPHPLATGFCLAVRLSSLHMEHKSIVELHLSRDRAVFGCALSSPVTPKLV